MAFAFIILLPNGHWSLKLHPWRTAPLIQVMHAGRFSRSRSVLGRHGGSHQIWSGIGFIPGGTVWFFKSGPFGWTGVICFWVPFVVFGTCILPFFFVFTGIHNV